MRWHTDDEAHQPFLLAIPFRPGSFFSYPNSHLTLKIPLILDISAHPQNKFVILLKTNSSCAGLTRVSINSPRSSPGPFRPHLGEEEQRSP